METDFLIVGGGIIGAATLHRLSRLRSESNNNTRLMLVEACASVAECASGKAGGFLAREWCEGEGAHDTLARASFDLHCEFAAQVSPEKIGFRPMRAVEAHIVKSSETQPKKEQQQQRPKWLDGASVGQCTTLVSDLETVKAAQVHPRLLTNAMIDEATSGGGGGGGSVVVKTRAAVQKLIFSPDHGRATGVVLADGTVINVTRSIVLCVGPWMPHVASANWVDSAAASSSNTAKQLLALAAKFSAHRVQSIVMAPRDFVSDEAIFTTPATLEVAEEVGCEPEIYPRPDGTVYCCGLSDKDPVPTDPSTVAHSPDKCAKLHRFAGSMSRMLGESEVAERQACFLPVPPDRRSPVIGPVANDDPSLFVAAGHTCWGILNAHGTGVAVAEMLQARFPDVLGRSGAAAGAAPLAPKLCDLLPSAILRDNAVAASAAAVCENPGKRGNEHW